MKLILSRKGFDGGNAGMASPIMPDGTPLSLPIPRDKGFCHSYADLYFRGQPLSRIISELANGTPRFDDKAHTDPDLDAERLPRNTGWRPIFGQAGGDQTHLQNQGVGVGDIFLFFGWFRHTTVTPDGKFCFTQPRDDFHAILGWLQVAEVHQVDVHSARILPEWALDHPHVATPNSFDSNNTIYISSKNVCLGGVELPVPGGGSFQHFTSRLRLTVPGGPRSQWVLPKWFFPDDKKPPLSYHGDLSRWDIKEKNSILKSVARGQEFVLDTSYYPEAVEWIRELLIAEARAAD
jgi:hypothetical protein